MVIVMLALLGLMVCLMASKWGVRYSEHGSTMRQFCGKTFTIVALGGVMLSLACSIAAVVGQII